MADPDFTKLTEADVLAIIAGSPAGDGAFAADADTQITPSTPIVLDEATGDEAALTLDYTTNKATSGNDTGLLVNKTDTLSPGTSNLLDLQVGGASKFKVNKDGNVVTAGTYSGSALSFDADLVTGSADSSVGAYAHKFISDANGSDVDIRIWKGRMIFPFRSTSIPAINIGDPGGPENANMMGAGLGQPIGNGRIGLWAFHACRVWASNVHVGMPSNLALGWGSSTAPTTSLDAMLYRDAAGILAQRNGVNAQTYNIYNNYTSATNFERAHLGWNDTADTFVIGTEAGSGGGTVRDIEIKSKNAFSVAINGTRQFRINTYAAYPNSASGLDLGIDIIRPWRDIYASGCVHVDQGTLTDDAQALNITSTWNDAADTFTLIKADVTDTASAAGSKLLDLQVGGASKFSVGSGGNVFLAGDLDLGGQDGVGIGNLRASADNDARIQFLAAGFSFYGSSGVSRAVINISGLKVGTGEHIGWTNSNANGSIDLTLYRDAANTLAQRNGVNAQTHRIYNTYTSATDFERAHLGWNDTADTFVIGTEAGSGGGTVRGIQLSGDVTSTGNINGASPTEMGFLSGVTSNIQDQLDAAGGGAFGADANTLITPSTPIVLDQATGDEAALRLDYTTNKATSGNDTGLLINNTDSFPLNSPGTSNLLDLQVGGASKFSVDKNGFASASRFSAGTNINANYMGITGLHTLLHVGSTGFGLSFYAHTGAFNINTQSGAYLGFSSGHSAYYNTPDLGLHRDAANTLGQRNGVNAQTYNIYNSYTSGTDFERAHLGWNDTADTFVIGTEAGSGGGVEREVHIYKGNTRCARFTGSWTFIDTANFYVSGPARFPNGVGLHGVTPPAQAAHIADATNATDVITRVNAILVALEDIGITAAS